MNRTLNSSKCGVPKILNLSQIQNADFIRWEIYAKFPNLVKMLTEYILYTIKSYQKTLFNSDSQFLNFLTFLHGFLDCRQNYK